MVHILNVFVQVHVMYKHTQKIILVIEGGPEPQPLHGSCVYTVVEELGTGEVGLTCNIVCLFICLNVSPL